MSDILEHNEEAAPGIPSPLPPSERLLWRGSPDWKLLARTRFHIRKLAAYFAVILLLFVGFQLNGGASVQDVVAGAVGYGLLAAVAMALVLWLARATARATIFSVTSRRIVIRCGIALPLTVNIPLSRIDSADLRHFSGGFGDIAITPATDSRVSYLLLWPYVMPWRFARVRPILRAVPNAEWVAETLGRALEADAVDRANHPAVEDESNAEIAPIAVDSDASASDDEAPRRWSPYPTVPLAAAAGLVVFSLIATTWITITDDANDVRQVEDIVSSVDLRFITEGDGSITVVEANENAVLQTLEPGTNGFLRSTLRGLKRSRSAEDATNDGGYSVLRAADGRLLFVDQLSGEQVDLWAFGETNAGVFAAFLPAAGQANLPSNEAAVTAVALKSEETTQ